MPQLVRVALNHNRWVDTEGREPPDLPADVLLDLRTKGNRLSVYEATEAVTPERIAIAFMASRNEPDHTAYAVIERAAVEALRIAFHKTDGTTIDPEVNSLHWDLEIGTTGKLVGFAGLIANAKHVPILKKQVEQLLKEGFESGRLDRTKNKLLCDRVKAKVPKPPEQDDPGAIESGIVLD